MLQKESYDKIINIFKEATTDFKNCFNKNLTSYYETDISDEEIILKFNVKFDRELNYAVIMKKQKRASNSIPKLKGYEPLEHTTNPYKKLKYTDENYILSRIYDLIQKCNFDEIVCYSKFGIIIRNPLELKGIYNINVKYIGD